MDPDHDEEEIEDVVLDDDEREPHLRMVLEDNNGGVDGTKALINAKKWCV